MERLTGIEARLVLSVLRFDIDRATPSSPAVAELVAVPIDFVVRVLHPLQGSPDGWDRVSPLPDAGSDEVGLRLALGEAVARHPDLASAEPLIGTLAPAQSLAIAGVLVKPGTVNVHYWHGSATARRDLGEAEPIVLRVGDRELRGFLDGSLTDDSPTLWWGRHWWVFTHPDAAGTLVGVDRRRVALLLDSVPGAVIVPPTTSFTTWA